MRKLINRKNKGFTLIELMIVVAIIGILAAIAIPNFIRYQLRSKTAEARTNIGGIKTAQESFRATEDGFASSAQNPVVGVNTVKVPWDDVTVRPCPTACNRLNLAACTEYACAGFEPAGQVYYRYDSQVQLPAAGQTAEFCVSAIGDLDGDGTNGEFEYQTSYDLAVATGVVNCAGAASGLCGGLLVAPHEVITCSAGLY